MKKEMLAGIAVILAVWFFVMGFEIGVFKERKANADKMAALTTNVAPQVNETLAPTEQQPTQGTPLSPVVPEVPGNNTPATSANNDATAPSSNSGNANTGGDVASLSTDEKLARAATAVNNLKATPNFTAVRKRKIVVNVVDCSVPRLINQVNDIVSGVVNKIPAEETYVFSGGVATDSEGTQINTNEIPPTGKAFALTSAGVSSATAEKQGDNVVYTFNLAPESTTAENLVPTHHSVSVGFLDLTSLGLPSMVKITKANMNYSGSTCKITVDKDGKMIKLENHIPMTGDGEASVSFASGNASFEGYLDESWEITY